MKVTCKQCGADYVATDELRPVTECYFGKRGCESFWEVKLECGCWERAEMKESGHRR